MSIEQPDSAMSCGAERHGVRLDHPTSSSLLRESHSKLWMRFLCLDLPLVIAFALFLTALGMKDFAYDYLLPQLELMAFSEEYEGEEGLTYFHRVCTVEDQSTFDAADLIVTPESTDGLQKMLQHGTALLPNLLSESTAAALREFILKENEVSDDLIYVIENKNRWSFPIRVDQDPTVIAALEELLGNEHLVRLLEEICGKDPAVIEFTAITAAEGAAVQYWHQDVTAEGSGVKYGRHFIPSYSLFVPLQNTTGEMGATGVCPGTHMCSNTDFCETSGFQVSGPNNLWPMGAGALVNQQTTHRGEAHSLGPHRVVFILTFAPRPRREKFAVETRMIGQSGSYSLHWSQWGHTLSDFANPNGRMRQPWRTLRSLGLYRCSGCNWGWDYIASSAMRISNYENGFGDDDAVNFVNKGGFWFLPEIFQGKVIENSEKLWVDVLMVTVVKTFRGFQTIYVGLLVAFLCIAVAPTIMKRSIKDSLPMPWKTFIPVLLLHACFAGIFWQFRVNIAQGPWGRNIRNGLSNTVEYPLFLADNDSPSVLPTNEDVMVFENMQSRYMESCTDVLDVFHPGNKELGRVVQHFSVDYASYPAEIQSAIRHAVRRNLRLSRILVQTAIAGWSEALPNEVDAFFHRRLVSARKPIVGLLLKELDFLQSEVRYGYWRQSTMQRKHITHLIRNLTRRVLAWTEGPNKQRTNPTSLPFSIVSRKFTVLERSTTISKAHHTLRTHQSLSFEVLPSEPFQQAWLREGDRVESFFEGNSAEWYPGIIASAHGNHQTWEVQFDDGDTEHHLCRECVVSFRPYKLGEWLQVRVSEDSFDKAQVVADHGNFTYDLMLETGHSFKGIRTKDIRRVYDNGLVQGARVIAKFPGGDNMWYPGYISAQNPDGTFAISYDDGDFAPSVNERDIRLQ